MNNTNTAPGGQQAGFKCDNGFLRHLDKGDLLKILGTISREIPLFRGLLIDMAKSALVDKYIMKSKEAGELLEHAREKMHGKKKVMAIRRVSKLYGSCNFLLSRAKKIEEEYGHHGCGPSIKNIIMGVALRRDRRQPGAGAADSPEAGGIDR